MANGTVQTSWRQAPVVCAGNNITYEVDLVPTDGNPVDDGIEVPISTNCTIIEFDLTPGREYVIIIRAKNTDCSILSDAIQDDFTAIQDESE